MKFALTTYSRKNSLSQLWLLLLLLLSQLAFAQISIEIDRNTALYEIGESATFNITSPTSGSVTYTLKYDNAATPIFSETVNINSGQTVAVAHQENEAGIVLCEVVQNGNNAIAAATFAPFQIEAFETEPSDLDSFWNDQKNLLANIPIDPQVSFHSSNEYSTTYRVNLANVDDRRVYGYLSVPKGEGSFPALVTVPPFGANANITTPEIELAERANVLSFSISIHNVELHQEDPNAYQPDDYANREGNYYRYAILGSIRAVDYIFSRNDFDGENLGFTGVSQGAGLSMIVGGLDDRVNYIIHSNPILCQNSGLKYERAGGFPNYINRSRAEVGTPEHEMMTAEAAKYYDAIYFSKKFQGASMTLISYEDVVTPAATSFAAFNQLPGPKILVHSIDLGHTHPSDYWLGRYDFLRRFIPGTEEPPFPWAGTTKGYFIDAGEKIVVGENESADLKATVEFNDNTNPTFSLKWEKVAGPGDVIFTDSAAYNTTATFSEPGIYTLQFKADDFSTLPTGQSGNLNEEQKYFTLIDFVEVEVGGIIIPPVGCDIPENVALDKPTNQSTSQFNGESSNANDGNTNGIFWEANSVALTNWSNQPWWEIDLEETTDIKTMNIWNRTDCCMEHFRDFYIFISDEPFASTILEETMNDPNVTSFFHEGIAGTPSKFEINSSGRYVRIQMSGSGFLSLAEVEIFGCVNTLLNQEILFDSIPDKLISDTSFEIHAEASSGLLVTFEILSGPASLDSNLVILDSIAGTVTIRATQAGDSIYNPVAVEQSFEIIDPNVTSCQESTNIALNKTTIQSGTQAGAWSYKAVDGNTDGNFWASKSVSLTNWQPQAWWEVDLEQLGYINSINIWNRTDCCMSFLNNFYVLVSDEPFVSTELEPVLSQPGVSALFINNMAGTPTLIDIERTGRYVRVQLEGTAFLALAEVEIFGCFLQNDFPPQQFSTFHEHENTLSDQIKIYPNPVDDFVNINLKSVVGKNAHIQIFNTLGKVMLEKEVGEIGNSELRFSTKNFLPGIYFMKIKVGNEVPLTLPFVKS